MNPIGAVRRVVFIRTDRLGETLLNLPAIAALKAALPQAALTLLVQPDLKPLLIDVAGLHEVLADAGGEGGWWLARAIRLAQLLTPYRFDLAVISNPKKEIHLAVWLAGIPCRVGYARKWGRWLLTHRIDDRKALGERHEVEYNLDLIRSLGLPSTIPQWQLPRFEREQAEVLQLIQRQGIKPSQPFIAVHPWASNPVKQWPADRFQRLIRECVERLGVQVVLIGGPEEGNRSTDVGQAAVPVGDLTGQLTLRQLAALLQMVRLLVSNDSGPVHLASAVGTKTVVLFGTPNPGTGPGRWGPFGEGHRVIWKPTMEAIGVEEVFDVVEQALSDA
ncbi:MAG: glycosyltransferase family 9 protein [Candidatus Omnitrophota bacterium]|nr:glycosyltransferase family 9 protein [Candidatus Omnitrophota bacterium]